MNINLLMNRWQLTNTTRKNTLRSQLSEIPEYTKHNMKRNQSYYTPNSKKSRLQQQKNTQIERSNRILCEKIRRIMTREKRTTSKRLNEESYSNSKKKLLLTFIKPSMLPTLTPSPIMNINKNKKKDQFNLFKILQNRGKYVDNYFKAIKSTRELIRKQQIKQEFDELRVGKWYVKGFIINNSIILRGHDKTRELVKKYPLIRVKDKIKKEYAKWVQQKFEFQL